MQGDDSVLVRVRQDPVLKKFEEKLLNLVKLSHSYAVEVVDYSDTVGGSAARKFTSNQEIYDCTVFSKRDFLFDDRGDSQQPL
jgi:hypothetical protein